MLLLDKELGYGRLVLLLLSLDSFLALSLLLGLAVLLGLAFLLLPF